MQRQHSVGSAFRRRGGAFRRQISPVASEVEGVILLSARVVQVSIRKAVQVHGQTVSAVAWQIGKRQVVLQRYYSRWVV